VPVSLVTIHHEGAGTPSDVPRGAAGGYTYWLGLSRYTWLRPVWSSYATLDYNHVSLDVCFSGDRMVSPVTDSDIALLRSAFSDAWGRGYVVGSPLVRAHRNSPGSSTVCPGDHTMARWADVVAACTKTGPPAPPPLSKEVEMPGFPSATKPANKFRGAIVFLADGKIDLLGGATAVPPIAGLPPGPWVTAYGRTDGKHGFVVVPRLDDDEYAYELP
jgi:hypothetical protein